MKGDFSRSTFDHKNHFKSAPLQQGRVQTDADANEQQAITQYRVETEAVDLIGGCGGPIHAAGFGLTPSADDLLIGAGRYYAGGHLCENDSEVLYSEQPDYPLDAPFLTALTNPPVAIPPADGTFLAYIDVWDRHLTALEAPHIREVALGGPDTATRVKNVWQVKLHQLDPTTDPVNPNCASVIPSWDAVTAPSTGQLSARAEAGVPSDDPCIVTPGAGFRRLENQLYRVEVHEGGSRNDATYKWSRDNGSIVARLESQSGASNEKLTLSSIGRDPVLRFAPGQWAEIIDDTHELHGLPGTLVQVVSVEGNVITIDPATRLPVGGTIDLAGFPLNPKVRRWDGVIENVSNENFRDLEDGVQVRIRGGNGDDGLPRRYRTGDYWTIPARTNTGEIEWPTENNGWRDAAGIHHHYCRLALLEFAVPNWTVLSDCRNLFPPVTELTSLFYVGGDGQETIPTNPILPHLLEVGVANGQWTVEGATVRFEVTEGTGVVNGAALVQVGTAANGVASCMWTVDAATQAQQVTATLLNAAGDAVHLPIHFGASLSVASEVAYTPGDNCIMPDTVDTVQEAIDELCSRGGIDEPGIHVEKITLGNQLPLLNDTMVRVEDLASGIQVGCDDDLIQASVQDKPVCFITLYLPYPFNVIDQELWGQDVIGSRPLRLDAEVNSDNNVIFWKPTDATGEWLVNRLFQTMEELKRGDRVLAYLTLKGNFIWSGKAEEQLFLDGEVFGDLRGDGSTDALLPSGNQLPGGDLEMWFWLVRGDQSRPTIIVDLPDVNFGNAIVGSPRTTTLVISNTGNATLVVTDMTIRDGSDYKIVTPVPFSLEAGKKRPVDVGFTPRTQGQLDEQLIISSNDQKHPQLAVALSGFGMLGLRAVPGIGAVLATRLEGIGVTRADEIAAMDEELLATTLNVNSARAAAFIAEARRVVNL